MDIFYTTFLLIFVFASFADAAVKETCTFQRPLAFGYFLKDRCNFQNSDADDFSWSFRNYGTPTDLTGPEQDHSQYPNGFYAYIESSYKTNGQFARMTKTYSKPAGDTQGCVQLYYHMYGTDIGTLNISVYDTTQSGLVANFQRTGQQGNRWLRADMDLRLPSNALSVQLILDASVTGSYREDVKGDIAVDDITFSTGGLCSNVSETPPTTLPTTTRSTSQSAGSTAAVTSGTTARSNWKCDFEGLDKNCGMKKLSAGASWSTASRSFSQSTGPQADHTSGNGHFLYMQGIGARENSTAVVETPRFDQSYNCFTFWYHMYGGGVRQLRVEAELSGSTQYLWSQSGNQGNSWKKARVRISAGAIKLIITAVRGSTSDSDIAIDDLELSTTDCDGLTVPTVTTTIPTQAPTTGIQPILQLACNFDNDYCNFYLDASGNFNWSRLNGGTFTSGTGPTNDHTQGDFSGYYMYLPSNYKVNGTKARIQTGLIDVTPTQSACLRFSYHMYGADMGSLNVRVKTASGDLLKSISITGDQGNSWKQKSIDIAYTSTQVYLEFEGTIEHSGGSLSRVLGEMAIDDIILTEWSACTDLDMIRVVSPVTAPTTTLSTVTPGSTAAPTSTPAPPTTSPWTTQTTTPSPVQMCNFDEESICGYQQSTSDDIDWSRYNAKVTSADTGPSADHTNGTSRYFMLIDASYKSDGTKAILTSPSYKTLSSTACLTFWYHMWGADMGTLSVSLVKAGQTTTLYYITGNQGNQWKQFSMPLDLSGSSSFQVAFTGLVTHSKSGLSEVLGDIAIDDVTIDRLGSSCSTNTPSTPPTTPPPSPTTQQTTTTTRSNTTPSGGIVPVKNCTFSKSVGWITFADFSYCFFTQSLTDNFQWSLASSATSTAGTGPMTDHTGNQNGYYAYIESTGRRPGTYARLSSPTFPKAAGVGGGCVQLYYHMYGTDIGTLNISVYDTTQSGLVANFQRTGNQGNQWLRASLNLNLAAAPMLRLQVLIDAYVGGTGTGDKRGDIAIDDIIIYDRGQCSQSSDTAPTMAPTTPTPSAVASTTAKQNWKCDFEALNKSCGLLKLSYGASFTVSTRSFSQTTGPQTDHTTGSGHFLYMQGIGARENGSAVVETPRFDQSYNCFTFWYHMYGGGVRQLRVEADINGVNQYLWSQSGNQGNNWKKARVRISAGAIKLIITAVRGSTSDSDIAIDDLELSTTDCDGLTVPTVTTTIPTQAPTTGIQPILQLACNFDNDYCNFYLDASGDFNWSRLNGGTFTSGTGPTNDHTQGDLSGYYMYLPSNYKVNGTKARIQSGLIDVTPSESACLRFSYHMYGADMGSLNVRVKTASGSVVDSVSITGDQGNLWKQKSVDVFHTSTQVYLEFEGTIEHSGGPLSRVLGEMAIDDIIFTKQSSCKDLNMIRVVSPVTAPTTTLSTVTPGSTAAPTSTPAPPTTSPWTTQTTTPSPVQACNFDQDYICGYQQSPSDDFDWSRYNAKVTSADTGPSADHTHGTSLGGYFMLIDASYKNNGDKAALLSPTYTTLSNRACLTFWYHMWGAEMGTLRVTLHKGTLDQQLFIKSGDQGNQWRQFSTSLELSGSNSFQITFTGVISHANTGLSEVLGDIAVDDVVIDRLNPCGSGPTTAVPPMTLAPSSGAPTASSVSAPASPAMSSSLLSTTSTKDNITAGGVAATGKQTDQKTTNAGVTVAVVLSVIVIMLVAVLAGFFVMRKKQLWLFSPGSKLSIKFSKPTVETAEIYDGHSNLYSSEPSLVINSNGLHKRGETSEA